MLTFEKAAEKIWETNSFRRGLLIGGILFYLPFVHLLWLGYLGLFMKKVLSPSTNDPFPDWFDLKTIALETLKFLPVWLVFWVLPWSLASLFSWAFYALFSWIGLTFLAWSLALIPLSIAAAVLPAILLSAIYSVNRRGDWNIFDEWQKIIRRVFRRFDRLKFPTLIFYGIVILGFPLIGWAAFAALIPYAATCAVRFQQPASDA